MLEAHFRVFKSACLVLSILLYFISTTAYTATCPSDFTLVTLTTPRNADSSAAGTSPGILLETQAYGPIQALGTNLQATGTAARLRKREPTLILDLTDIVADNSTIILSIARNNNSGSYAIDASLDNVTFSGAVTFNAGPNDISQQINYTVPVGGARYIRFSRIRGSLWVDGVQYSQICQPNVDLSITKDDGSLTYTPGGTGIYTITVFNNGPHNVVGATIADYLPSGVMMTSAWICTTSSASSSCNTTPSATNPISIDVDIINGDSITVMVPVQFSANMEDY